MAWTWEEILTDALSLSGIKGEDQELDPQMLKDARTRASKLLDELDGEGIALPLFSTDIEFNTVTGQVKYVLGTGSDLSPASAFRPETIIDAQIQIQGGGNQVWFRLDPISFPDYRDKIAVPRNQSQPINYTWNPKWPQGDFYLWPNPSQVWTIRLTATLKWIDVVTNPETGLTTQAQLPSGYTSAFTDVLALKLAQWRRTVSPDLESNSRRGKYIMSTYSLDKVPNVDGTPSAFPWNITYSGTNP